MVNPDDLLNFIELGSFVASWEELGLEDDDLAALQIGLMSNPRQGPLIKDTGGLRKLRFSPTQWKKGKSGALRVGYVYFEKYGLVVLVLVYKKGVLDNIPAADRKKAPHVNHANWKAVGDAIWLLNAPEPERILLFRK